MNSVRGHHSRGEHGIPSETHQITHYIDADTVKALLQVLLDPSESDESRTATLADFGIGGGALDLWRTVCEEFGERTLGSEVDLDLFDPAVAAAIELTDGCHHGL